MINNALINPRSIVVVGASNDIHKPGGKILKNLLDNAFQGQLYVANPKQDEVQGVKSYKDLSELPQTDLAILAVAAAHCPAAVELLARQKGTRAFIIISAGFSEENEEGAKLEKQIVDIVNSVDGCLIGPNCTGILTPHHASMFTLPIPELTSKGCDFISGSGATAVFIMESAILKGIKFSNVFAVGNSAQTGVEDVLAYMDETFDPETSSRIKLLYVENIKDPDSLLEHASSLIRKGCKIAAIKAGASEAGSRAASSHTGAIASSDLAVEALFRKAGIVRCFGREELTTVAGVFLHKPLQGKKVAIITHAGGPAVMLTDALSAGGLEIPKITGPKAEELRKALLPGSSVANPIDFLATGTAEHLGLIIDYCNKHFDNIDGMVVIFGTPGLSEIFDVYKVLHQKMATSKKPIFPVLPSLITAKREVEYFLSEGHISFPDEVLLGRALTRIFNTPSAGRGEDRVPRRRHPQDPQHHRPLRAGLHRPGDHPVPAGRGQHPLREGGRGHHQGGDPGPGRRSRLPGGHEGGGTPAQVRCGRRDPQHQVRGASAGGVRAHDAHSRGHGRAWCSPCSRARSSSWAPSTSPSSATWCSAAWAASSWRCWRTSPRVWRP